MSEKIEYTREKRLRTWADLTFLEQMIARSKAFLGVVPGHWQRARDLLYRDLLNLLRQNR